MKPIARFLARRADFPSVVRAHLATLLCFSSLVFSIDASAVAITRCSDQSARPGRYIVRAVTSAANDIAQKSTGPLDHLAKQSRLIHRAPRVLARVNSQHVTEKSTSVLSTFASRLGSEDVEALSLDESVLSIEEDCLVHIDALPNDPLPVEALRSREQLNLPEAWKTKTDSGSVVVAISDTGVDFSHEDLASNMWTNPLESPGVLNIDDDENGCIDDIHGCDFGDGDGDPSPPKTSNGSHGTHVAGIIGAVANNARGSAGVVWKTKLLIAKGFDAGGYASISDLLNTVYYSINNGARVINCSWGADRDPTEAERDAFQYALDSGVLAVVAAGNSSVDAAHSSPAALGSVLTVGSINSRDQVSSFSNFGSRVSLYAPGGDAGVDHNEYIYSTFPNNQYGLLRGTSMAAPFVSGIAALVFSVNPKLSAVDVRNILVLSARTVISRLPDGSSAEIRIPDAAQALSLASTYTPTPFGVSPQTSPPVYQSPKADHSTPEFTQTSSTSSCALHHSAGFGSLELLFLILPLMLATYLRVKPRDA